MIIMATCKMKHHAPTKSIVLFLCLLFSVFFAQNRVIAQSDPIPFVMLNSGESVGQTFTSLHQGLNEIGITLSSENGVKGELQLNLYHNGSHKTLLLSKEYPVIVSSPKFLTLAFETQKDSYLKDYFLELNWNGSGPINLQTNPSESYGQGSLYINSSPVLAQLDFNPKYDLVQLSLGLGSAVVKWFWQFFMTALILALPGWAIMLYFWPGWKNYDFLTKLSLSFGFSYALYPIIFLLTDLINFHPGEFFFVWIVMGISGLLLFFHYWPDLRRRQFSATKLCSGFRLTSIKWQNLTFIIIIGLVFFVKFWAIRTLDTPMWGDSYQHTMITQLMMNNGGLFDSWHPYVPYETLTVHFGFHAISTVFAWISDLNASQSVLWIGQISNALAALSLYPIAHRVSGNKNWAGIIAVIFAGLVLKYPNYYVNWGRYAQLSGQVLLPLVGFLLIEALFSENGSTKKLAIVSVFLGGMGLCYYRMPFFLILWLPLLIGEMTAWLRQKENRFTALLLKTVIILIGTAILLIPLFIRISGGVLAESIGSLQPPTIREAVTAFFQNLISTRNYYSQPIMVLTIVSIVVSLITKQWRVMSILLGMVMLHAYKIGTVVNLPFSSYIDNFSLQIMSYIGLSVILAIFFALLAEHLEKIPPAVVPFLLISLTLFFAITAKNVTDKTYEMVTEPDLRAFQWIVENTKPDDLFLVNGFTIYNNTSGVGSDGGWWISLLTDRENTMPPQYAVLNEKPESPGYTDWTVDLINRFETYPPNSKEGITAMCTWGIDYIYIGQKQGSVNDRTPLLKWQEWGETSALSLVYAQDHVRIYQFNPSFCVTNGPIPDGN